MLGGSYIWASISKYQRRTPKVPRKAFNIVEVWNPVTTLHLLTKLLSSYCRAHLVESYCRESNISDTNWLRYLSSYLIKIWLSVWHHQLANLHISKTWISLERKEICKILNSIFVLIQTMFLCFKVSYIGKMQFSS